MAISYMIYIYSVICLLINLAVAILDIPLVSIRTEIVKPDKVGTFYIVVKCFLIYPKNSQGELTSPESQALIFGLIFYVHLALIYLYLSLSWWYSVIGLIFISF